MSAKYRDLQQRADFEITVNWKEVIKAIESNISIQSKAEPEPQCEYEQKSNGSHTHYQQDLREN
jgi:hypothetical protein